MSLAMVLLKVDCRRGGLQGAYLPMILLNQHQHWSLSFICQFFPFLCIWYTVCQTAWHLRNSFKDFVETIVSLHVCVCACVRVCLCVYVCVRERESEFFSLILIPLKKYSGVVVLGGGWVWYYRHKCEDLMDVPVYNVSVWGGLLI